MPFAAPLAEMLRKVRSSAWIVVFWTLRAVPVVVVSVLFGAVGAVGVGDGEVAAHGGHERRVGSGAGGDAAVEADQAGAVRRQVDALGVVGDEAVDVDGAAVTVGHLDRAGRGAGGR